MSKIEWTELTWNPFAGCSEKSPGCRNCYAAKMAWRLMHNPQAGKDYEGVAKKLPNGKIVWTGQINLLEHKLLLPVLKKNASTFFVNSMSDLFHAQVPFKFIDKVFAVMMLCPQHIFQVLTKWPQRMQQYCQSRMDFDQIQEAAEMIVADNPHLFHVCTKLTREERNVYPADVHISNELLPYLSAFGWFWDMLYRDDGEGGIDKDRELIYEETFPAKHIWLGTSIENQKEAERRGPHLFELYKQGWTTWVSNEPAIGPVNWEDPFYFGFLDWMVTGGESGADARPMHPQWARSARDFCEKNKIPFFFKQWGQWAPVNEVDPSHDIVYNDEGEANAKYPHICISIAGKTSQVANEVITENEPNCILYKFGKKISGRQLDGRLHDAMPDMETINSISRL